MLNKQTIEEIKTIIFSYLNPKKDKVFLFGSRAIGDARKFSDIDIGIKTAKKLPSETKLAIEEAFEESNIPYTIDVVDFSQTSDQFRDVALKKIISLN